MFGENEEKDVPFDNRVIKSKIACTIGPAVESKEMLSKLVNSGMNVARLNFSHGKHEWHANVIKTLREVSNESGKHVAVMMDLKGPHIRTGYFKEGVGGRVQLKAGQPFTFHVNFIQGDRDRVTISYWNLPKLLKPGDRLLVDYGRLGFTVVSIDDKAINTIVDSDGVLGENKVVVVHGVDERAIDMHFMTYEDTVDVDFAMRHGVEIIAANYVNKASDIDEVRRLPGVPDRGVLVFAKIETKQAIENAEAIIQAADGIVLPRSDIAVDMPVEQVAHAQKILIRLANLHGKPVFIANQILNSMVQNPRPTRAECTDIANAVLEGADGIILTDTTAIGKYPVETVEMSRRQFAEVERAYPHRKKYTEIRNHMLDKGSTTIAESIASSAVKTSWDLDSTLLIVVTRNGGAVQKVAKYKGHAPILVATANEVAARAVQVYGGAIPVVISPEKLKGSISLDLFKELAQTAIQMGIVRAGEYVIAVWGKSPDIDDLFQYQVIQV